ncbi:MAG: SDR family oxidoreductase [Anaerolineales bacterium]|jgi:dTDP-4-dehydrorhamnose reductase
MRILVTGASGLLGLNLALEAAKDHDVVGIIKDHPIKTDTFTVLQTDLLAPGAVEDLLDQSQPDWIIHCAALANVDACETDPLLAQKLNSELPRKLATYVGRGGARLLHVSTDAVFDGQRGGYSEQDMPNPLSVYARTKLDGERAVVESNPDAIIARVNLYGWSLSGKRSLAEFFFNNLSGGIGVSGFTDVFFCPLLVNDLADIFLKMLDSGLSGLYHVLSPECISKYQFGTAIAQKFGFDQQLITPTSVESGGLRAKRSPRLTLRVDKLTQALGEPPPDLSTGLDSFYTLYQQGYPQKLRQLGSW